MARIPDSPDELRHWRNRALYRSLTRTLRVYHARLIADLHGRGFTDFSPAFPRILSNLDIEGTRIGTLAARAGVTRQAAGQLIAEIERCGYVRRRAAANDARATVVTFTARGRKLMAAVFANVIDIDADFARALGAKDFERVRAGLAKLADAIDPIGRFGAE